MSNNKQTPKDKAKELVDKMWNIDERYESIGFPEAKQCALITVNEILSINSVDKDVELSDYWEEVKQEIEKL